MRKDTIDLLTQHHKWITSVAHRVSLLYGYPDVEELESVGRYAIASRGHHFDPERGKVTTFIYHTAGNAMRDFLRRERKLVPLTDRMEAVLEAPTPAPPVPGVERLLEEGGAVTALVKTVLGMRRRPRNLKTVIRRLNPYYSPQELAMAVNHIQELVRAW